MTTKNTTTAQEYIGAFPTFHSDQDIFFPRKIYHNINWHVPIFFSDEAYLQT